MFGFLKKLNQESWKRAKYEVSARDHIMDIYNYDIERIGGLELARVTDKLISEMDKLHLDGEVHYTRLLVEELRRLGYF